MSADRSACTDRCWGESCVHQPGQAGGGGNLPEPVHARLIPASDETTVRRTLVLALLQDHRRVQNVRSCTGHGCAWRPEPVGRTGDPEAMRRRHAQFNAHLADLIVGAV